MPHISFSFHIVLLYLCASKGEKKGSTKEPNHIFSPNSVNVEEVMLPRFENYPVIKWVQGKYNFLRQWL